MLLIVRVDTVVDYATRLAEYFKVMLKMTLHGKLTQQWKSSGKAGHEYLDKVSILDCRQTLATMKIQWKCKSWLFI